MPWRREDSVETKCYASEKSPALRISGAVLIAVGVVVILLFVPCWALAALVGLALVGLGIVLIRK